MWEESNSKKKKKKKNHFPTIFKIFLQFVILFGNDNSDLIFSLIKNKMEWKICDLILKFASQYKILYIKN